MAEAAGEITPPRTRRHACLSQAIAAFAVETPAEDLPEDARHILRLSLLDWFAVAHAGASEPVSRIVRELALRDGGAPEASIIGQPNRLPARAASLVNATTGHALDYDDTHFDYVGHPSAAILPAALAIAQKERATGVDFLAAALIGVETACRVGAWLGRAHYDHGFHQTATSGSFGAAMAASRLLGLDTERCRHALGIASTRASGLKSQFGTMGKPLNAGIAAANGVEAALLASAGFISRPDGLECEQGFADTHAGSGRDPADVLEGLGTRFAFASVQHKFHACCHGLHAALEALTEARDSHALRPDGIASVAIEVNPSWLRVCNIDEPATALEAKFSYRLTAAMVLAGRDTSALATFTDAICRDARLVGLRDRVTVAGDASLADTAARVRITRRTGDPVEVAHDFARPLAAAARQARVRAKAAVLLGRDRADRLCQEMTVLGKASTPVDWPDLFAI
jgi:2-methylcitrate dehydratase PrpD